MSNYAVEVKNIKKSFFLPHHKNNSLKTAITQVFKPKEHGGKAFNALNGVSFNIEKGDFFGILGRNGSGKSTLLKIISEIYQPTSGSVRHDGKLVSFIELGVGFKPELSGRENVFLNGALLGFSKEEIAGMYDDIVEFAELEEFMDQKLKNYSSGMKVRLAFSVAIRAKADILILDEVLAVGDAAFQQKCNDYFRTLKDDKKTVILVTHSMGAVKQFCNKAILIENGKVAQRGNAEEIADEYLKLFDENTYKKEIEKKAAKERSGSDRWGSGELTLRKITTRISRENVIISLKVQNNVDSIMDAVIAIDVFDRNRKLVGGIESFRVVKQPISFAKNESKLINLSIRNIFGGGKYYVYAAIRSKTGDTIYDFMKNAAEFENTYETEQYFPTILPTDIEVIQSSNNSNKVELLR